MIREERIARLSESIRKHQDARAMTQSPVWADLWNELEQELLERLLACDATDDERRYRCATAIAIARDLRRTLEVKGVTPDHLEKQMAILDGSKQPAVA